MDYESMEEDRSSSLDGEVVNVAEENSHCWQKVSYVKNRNPKKKKASSESSEVLFNDSVLSEVHTGMLNGLDTHTVDSPEESVSDQDIPVVYDGDEVLAESVDYREEYDCEDESGLSSGITESVDDEAERSKKEQRKKVKKRKLTVAEAAQMIDADDLAAFLFAVSELGPEDLQLMRFAEYFELAFRGVNSSQFPWVKLFSDSRVANTSHVPVSDISEAVYKTSVDWLNHHSHEALRKFVVWALGRILADLAVQQARSKAAKQGTQPASSKSQLHFYCSMQRVIDFSSDSCCVSFQVAVFLVLAMVLRRKPDVLISVLPTLVGNVKYQSQDKLPIIIWMIVQSCHGDLAVGLYLWSHHILPILQGKSASNPRLRDLVLQLVERILDAPKAHSILMNSPVRKGERLVPPAALELLLYLTFPSPAARVKATERFETIYPILKDIALAGSPGSKAMLQVSRQLLIIAVKATEKGTPELFEESNDIFSWCLALNPDCFRQWEEIYVDNIEFSVAILKKVEEEFEGTSEQDIKKTLRSFRPKNKEELRSGGDEARLAFFEEADEYCEILSNRCGCFRTMAAVGVVVMALGVAATAMPI